MNIESAVMIDTETVKRYANPPEERFYAIHHLAYPPEPPVDEVEQDRTDVLSN